MNKALKKPLMITASILFWFAVWWIAAVIVAKRVGNYLLLPTPPAVLRRLGSLAVTSGFWGAIGLSMLRVFSGILATIVLGIILAVITESFSFVKVLIMPLMNVIKATPVASFIFLIFLWIDRDTLPAVIAGMMVLPIIWENVGQGIRSTDKKLLEMSKVFGFSKSYKFKYLYLPSIKPYLIAGCKSGISIGWKAGIASEVIVVPVLSIGRMIFYSKQDIETADLFAWTLTTIILSIIVENLISFASGKLNSERRKSNA